MLFLQRSVPFYQVTFFSYLSFYIETEHPEDCEWEHEKREKVINNIGVLKYKVASVERPIRYDAKDPRLGMCCEAVMIGITVYVRVSTERSCDRSPDMHVIWLEERADTPCAPS